jgi:hypothetical protein
LRGLLSLAEDQIISSGQWTAETGIRFVVKKEYSGTMWVMDLRRIKIKVLL